MPSNLARRVVNDLQQYGEVRRGSIGYVETRAAHARSSPSSSASPDARGVARQAMRRDSAAYEAGLRPGDIIVAFNGTAVTDAGQLSRLISGRRDRQHRDASRIMRDGRRIELKVPIERSRERRCGRTGPS